MNQQIILASASPRRKEILEKLKIPFSIIPADIDESIKENESPYEYVERLAIEKAQIIATQYPDAFVIGSDLTCELDGASIGKAENKLMAKNIISNFSGKTHFGRCGWAVIKGSTVLASGVATTIITFNILSDKQIDEYISSNQWVGFAGAYAIQIVGKKFIKSFNGSFYDILGLPIYHIASTLRSFGIAISNDTIEQIQKEDILKTKML
jgi:septum formation protein